MTAALKIAPEPTQDDDCKIHDRVAYDRKQRHLGKLYRAYSVYRKEVFAFLKALWEYIPDKPALKAPNHRQEQVKLLYDAVKMQLGCGIVSKDDVRAFLGNLYGIQW
jgi:hypothetical protein